MKIENLRGSKVISIQPKRSEVKFPAISQVEAYWEALRNGRPMPYRSEVDPRGICDVLEHAFVLEKIAPGVARIRLAGGHINDLMGMEVRGMPLSALFLPEARPEVQIALAEAFDGPASVRLNLTGDRGMTRPGLEAQMFLAPMKDEKGQPTRILGVLQSKGRIGRAPRRFKIRTKEVNALFGDASGMPISAPTKPSRITQDIPGFAEHKTGFNHVQKYEPATNSGQTGHLRLVYDADA